MLFFVKSEDVSMQQCYNLTNFEKNYAHLYQIFFNILCFIKYYYIYHIKF